MAGPDPLGATVSRFRGRYPNLDDNDPLAILRQLDALDAEQAKVAKAAADQSRIAAGGAGKKPELTQEQIDYSNQNSLPPAEVLDKLEADEATRFEAEGERDQGMIAQKQLDMGEADYAAKVKELAAFQDEYLAMDPASRNASRRGEVIDTTTRELEQVRKNLDEYAASIQQWNTEASGEAPWQQALQLAERAKEADTTTTGEKLTTGVLGALAAGIPTFGVGIVPGFIAGWNAEEVDPLGPDTALARELSGLKDAEDVEQWFAELRADPERFAVFRKAAEENKDAIAAEYQKLAPDTRSKTFAQHAVELLLAPVEVVGGVGSAAADLIGGDDPYTEADSSKSIRERGREFFGKFGDIAAVGQDQAIDTILGEGTSDIAAQAQRNIAEYAESPDATTLEKMGAFVSDLTSFENRSAISSEAFKATVDPLNLIDFGGAKPSQALAKGYEALKATKLGAKLIEVNPQVALWPEKLQLRLAGEARAAEALGDEGMTQFDLLQKTFERDGDLGLESIQIYQDAMRADAQTFAKLTQPQREEALYLMPGVVEQTKMLQTGAQAAGMPMTYEQARHATAQAMTKDAVVAQAIEDAAPLYEDLTARTLAWEQRGKLSTPMLDSEYGYYMTQRSDRYSSWLAKNPTARQVLLGTEQKISRQQADDAWKAYERGRLDEWRGLTIDEKEALIREQMKPYGLADDTPIFSRDAFKDLAARSRESWQAMKYRHAWESVGEVFGKNIAGEWDEFAASYPDLVQQIADENSARKWLSEARAGDEAVERAYAAAELERAKGVTKDAASEARQAEIAGERAVGRMEKGQERLRGVAEKARQPGVADKVSAELADRAKSQGDEQWRAGQRVEDVRTMTSEAQAGSKVAYEMGRDAEQQAVKVAEALREEAADLVTKTPGATEARASLKEARKILVQARKSEDLTAAAAEIAEAFGFKLPNGAKHDAVAAAEMAVKYVQRHIRSNPAIKNADAALRAANQLLADARSVAAKVETLELSRHVDALTRIATDAAAGKGIGAKYLSREMLRELEKAKKVADEAKDFYAKRAEGIPASQLEHKYRTVRDVRAALSKMRSELRKDAPMALQRAFERAGFQAERMEQALRYRLPAAIRKQFERTAEGVERGMREGVHAAYQARKAVGAAGQAAEDAKLAGGLISRKAVGAAQSKATEAEKAYQAALKRAEDSDFNKWSPEVKAAFVDHVLEKNGVSGPKGHMSALQVMRDMKLQIPETLDELTKLATTYLSPQDVGKAKRFIDDFIAMPDTPGAVGRAYDALKGIAQRAYLSVPGSASKDIQGQVQQAFLAGVTPDEWADAWKALGGNPEAWAKGIGVGFDASDDVLRGMNEGWLNLAKGEAIDQGGQFGTRGTFAKMGEQAESGIGKAFAKPFAAVEDKGLLGAVLPGKAGKAATRATDAMLNARMGNEQALRLATYRKAIKKGASHEEAVEEVYRYWGKFDELSKFSRKYLNRIFFFWSWRRASIPIAIRNILDHPVRSRMILAALAGGGEQDEEEPSWFRRMGGAMLGVDENGNADAIGTGGSTYFSTLQALHDGSMAQALRQGDLGASIKGAGQDIIRSAPPFVQGAVEPFLGMDFYTMEPHRTKEGESNVKVPSAFVHFTSESGDQTWVEKAMGLNVSADGRRVTADPKWSWLPKLLPWLGIAAREGGAWADPNSADLGDLSLKKGALRAFGVPLYSFKMSTEQERQVKELKDALYKDAASDPSLSISYGQVLPDKRTLRGKKLAEDMDTWKAEAKEQGLRGAQSDAYVDQRLIRNYFDQWRVMDMDRRLSFLQGRSKMAEPGDLSLSDRVAKQIKSEREAEEKRMRRELGLGD